MADEFSLVCRLAVDHHTLASARPGSADTRGEQMWIMSGLIPPPSTTARASDRIIDESDESEQDHATSSCPVRSIADVTLAGPWVMPAR